MSIEFKIPELGENIAGGDIVNVLVQEGDVIAANDGLFELETDKAVIEIPCPHAGKVAKLLVKKGQAVKVGQVVAVIEAEDAAVPTPASAAKPSAPQAPAAAAKTAAPAPTPAAAPTPAPLKHPTAEGPIPAGPAARRVARELGLDIRQVAGSGERGRITPEDVQTAATGSAPAALGPAPQRVVPPGEVGQDSWGEVRRDKMSKIRRTIAAQMVKSCTIIPHVTNFDDADVTDLENLRNGVPPDYIAPGLKLTSMPFVLKAVALALAKHPTVNASIDDEKEEIVYKQYVNVGVAVDTPRGLVVPVMRNVDRLSISAIAKELAGMAKRARNAEFGLEEIRGGTFTISNLGAVGGTYSTPVINHPEVAILLLGRSRWLPVVRDGQIVPRFMMPLSLSYDHRIIDGAAAGRFLNEVKDFLQSPAKLLL